MTVVADPAGPAIDLTDVVKTYRGRVQALRGIEMRVRRGEIFGLLGPNGAGKSTLVKILMSVVRPTRCAGTMLGRPVGSREALLRVGYLPENPRFPGYLTGEQTLQTYAMLAKVPREKRRVLAEKTLRLVGMTDWRRRKLGTYSKGMKQRIGLAQALMNDPELVMLDEPTDGVDPVGRREIREMLLTMKAEGRTVFVNSHLLSEVETLCDRVAILVKGKVARQGTIEELTRATRRYTVEIVGPTPETEALRRALAALRAEPAPAGEGMTGFALAGVDAADVQPLIDALRGGGAIIAAVRPLRQSLEDLFMEAVIDPETQTYGGVGAVRGKGGRG